MNLFTSSVSKLLGYVTGRGGEQAQEKTSEPPKPKEAVAFGRDVEKVTVVETSVSNQGAEEPVAQVRAQKRKNRFGEMYDEPEGDYEVKKRVTDKNSLNVYRFENEKTSAVSSSGLYPDLEGVDDSMDVTQTTGTGIYPEFDKGDQAYLNTLRKLPHRETLERVEFTIDPKIIKANGAFVTYRETITRLKQLQLDKENQNEAKLQESVDFSLEESILREKPDDKSDSTEDIERDTSS